MSWVCERSPATATTTTTTSTTTKTSSSWKKVFLSLKGSDLFLYETPPVMNSPAGGHDSQVRVAFSVETVLTKSLELATFIICMTNTILTLRSS